MIIFSEHVEVNRGDGCSNEGSALAVLYMSNYVTNVFYFVFQIFKLLLSFGFPLIIFPMCQCVNILYHIIYACCSILFLKTLSSYQDKNSINVRVVLNAICFFLGFFLCLVLHCIMYSKKCTLIFIKYLVNTFNSYCVLIEDKHTALHVW